MAQRVRGDVECQRQENNDRRHGALAGHRALARHLRDRVSVLLCRVLCADVVLYRFQEIVDLNAGSLLVDHNASKPWEDKIEKTLKSQYATICSKHLVGLSLVVYIKKELLKHVTDIQFDTVGVGIMGVGVSFSLVCPLLDCVLSECVAVCCAYAGQQRRVCDSLSDFRLDHLLRQRALGRAPEQRVC